MNANDRIKIIAETTWVNTPQVIDMFSKHLVDLEIEKDKEIAELRLQIANLETGLEELKTKLDKAMLFINNNDMLWQHILLAHDNERLSIINKNLESKLTVETKRLNELTKEVKDFLFHWRDKGAECVLRNINILKRLTKDSR